MRVLVVDDNPANVEYFVGALETAGHVVEVEVDGTAGRDRALREAFDLIILDIQLPSMSGEAVCRELYNREGHKFDTVRRALREKDDGQGGRAGGNPLWLRLALDLLNQLDEDFFARQRLG